MYFPSSLTQKIGYFWLGEGGDEECMYQVEVTKGGMEDGWLI